MRLSILFSALFASTALAGSSPHKRNVFNKAKPMVERKAANQHFQHPELQKRATRFLTDKTAPFEVNGTGIPEVPFDIGESYAGLLPISDDPEETRKLFFWYEMHTSLFQLWTNSLGSSRPPILITQKRL
jgi:carboxypeptidase D